MKLPKTARALFLSLLLPPAAARAIDDAPLPADGLTGKDIYEKVINNKLNTSYLEHRMISTDPGGSVQTLEFWSRFKDLRTPESAPVGTVISKTVMKFTNPFDKRETAYLFIEKRGTEDEGFHYSRKRTRVTRIAPAKESIFGTDFSLDDLAVVRHVDDATYERLPDEEVQGEIVWVVDVTHKPETDPAYARSMLYVHKTMNVPLRTRHWDEAGVEVKQLAIPKDKIELFAGVWIPMESTMNDLSEKTNSVLYVDRVVANPEIPDVMFTPQKLPNLDPLGASADQQSR